jgi:MFS family permease
LRDVFHVLCGASSWHATAPGCASARNVLNVTSAPQHTEAGHPPATVRPPVRGMRNLLRVRDLRRLVGVRLLAALGDGAFQGALANAVLFDPLRQSSPAEIATGFAVLLLPYSLIGPFAGSLLDRWSRQQVLLWANFARAAIIGVLAVLLAFGTPLWALFTVSLLVIGTGRFVGSGLSASIPHVIATSSLVGANALSTTVGSIASVIGGGYALGMRALIGGGPIQVALITASVALFYLASGLSAMRFTRTALGPDEFDEPAQPVRAVLDGFISGFRHVVQRPTVGVNIGMVVLVRFAVGLSTLVVVLLFQNYFVHDHGIFRSGIAGLGEVLAISGVGLFLGAVVTAPMVRWLGRTKYLVIMLILSAVGVAVAGSQFSQLSTMITALIVAFGYQSSKVCADTVAQADSDDAHIGRVFALYDTANNVLYVVAFALGVRLVPDTGRSQTAVFLVAVIYVVTAVAYGFAMRALRTRAVSSHRL